MQNRNPSSHRVSRVDVNTGAVYFQEDIYRYKFDVNKISSLLGSQDF